MMKKSLIASVVLSAFAFTASAASVSLFGTVDTGLVFDNYKNDATGSKSTTVTMNSSISGPSRWGMRGTEKLSKDFSVSFNLENGFNSDTGAQGDGERLFNRECRLTLNTPVGEFSFGRMGAFTSSAGYYDLFMGMCDIYDGGWSRAIGAATFFPADGRWDNMMTYATPSANGFRGYVQYSGGANGAENFSSNDRYMGIAVTYDNGPLNVVAVYDKINRARLDDHLNRDTGTVSVGASYDFSCAKLFANVQIGKKESGTAGWPVSDDGELAPAGETFDGISFHIGAQVPVCAGRLKVGVYNSNLEGHSDSSYKVRLFNVAATYEYPFSKKTYAYVGAGFLQKKFDGDKSKTWNGVVGLSHSF